MNTKIKKSLTKLLTLIILIIGIAAGIKLIEVNQDIREKAAPATTIFVSPTTQNLVQNQNFSFLIKANSGPNLITALDLKIKFDKSAMEITSIEKLDQGINLANQITTTYDNSNGTIDYIIYTLDKTKAISGEDLTILKINAKTKNVSGDYSISFEQTTAAAAIDEGQNVITNLNSGNIMISSASDPQPTATSGTGGIVEGEPNSCGGTCGSNYNCKANLFCYQGFCRNPICVDDKDCDCAVSVASATATAKPTIKVTPSSGVITNIKSPTPKATASPTSAGFTPLPREITEAEPENQFVNKYAMYIFAGFMVLVTTILYFMFKKPKVTNIPQIMPPTNI